VTSSGRWALLVGSAGSAGAVVLPRSSPGGYQVAIPAGEVLRSLREGKQ
jgi:hypothetical protein